MTSPTHAEPQSQTKRERAIAFRARIIQEQFLRAQENVKTNAQICSENRELLRTNAQQDQEIRELRSIVFRLI